MDILRLDSSYRPDTLVEGYSSMIWSERHLEDGDFELKTSKVSEAKDLLPEDTLITHLDTEEVMFVETHSIDRDENGAPQLTIKGRSLDTFSEQRALVAPTYGEDWFTLQNYTTADVCAALLWTYLTNDSEGDSVAGWSEDPLKVDATISPRFRVNDLVITDSTTLVEAAHLWSLSGGELKAKLKEFLDLASLGVRSIRPTGKSGRVVSVNTTRTAARGTISRTLTADIQQLRLDLYNGSDRTRNQLDNTPVVFHYDSGHIDNPSYLFSNKELRLLAIVASNLETREVWKDTGLTPPAVVPTGFDLRALYVDGGSFDKEVPVDADPADPNYTADHAAYLTAMDEYNAARDAFLQSLTQKGQIELAKHNRTEVFDGAISTLSPYRYGEEYFLGDLVTLAAEYGYEATMRVTEYVRTEDSSGDRGYPTLVLAE